MIKFYLYFSIFFLLFGSLTNAASDGLTLSAAGVGPINAKTKFSQKKVQKLLQKFTVKKSTDATEGEEFPTLQVFSKANLLLTINADSTHLEIFSIVIENNEVKNSFGKRIGFNFNESFKKPEEAKCHPGSEEISGKVKCEEPEFLNIHYLFTGSYDGPDGEIPPIHSLKNWKIEKIIWKPKP